MDRRRGHPGRLDELGTLQRAVLVDGTHGLPSFTGRAGELAHLDSLLTDLDRPAPAIVTIDGAPGVGKSTLAGHWAHRVPAALRLHLDLRGYGSGEPLSPAAAAEALLHALGEAVPDDRDERFAALRTALAGRRALVLLDNARDADQVLPLLPDTAALVIVTSRDQLRGLPVRDGAHRVTLHGLRRRESVELLAAAVGQARVTREPAAAARIAELCDDLPLALAIAAERAHRSTTLAEVVAELEHARLDALDTGEDSVRRTLSWSYRALPATAAAMFRALGVQPERDVDVRTAAALVGLPVRGALVALDQLVAVHLVEQHRPGRYEVPDLVHRYAAEVAWAGVGRRSLLAAHAI